MAGDIIYDAELFIIDCSIVLLLKRCHKARCYSLFVCQCERVETDSECASCRYGN